MENKEGFNRWQKIWLGLTLFGAGFSFWFLLIAGDKWQEKEKTKLAVSDLRIKVGKIDELEIEKEILGSRVSDLDGFFLKGEKGVAEAAQAMEQAAGLNGVSLILNFEDFPKRVDIGGKYQTGLKMNMEVQGSYQAIASWILNVERLPYLIKINEVKMSLPHLGGGVRANLKGVVFLKNE